MKTDSLFYQIFLTFPDLFFDLIDRPSAEARAYEFTSREVKQLAFRLDGLFWPTDSNSNQPFYLVEVQFQPDGELYYRLFAELFLFLRQYQPPHPWQVVVIYPNRRVEREIPLQFGEMLSLQRVRRIYLDELGEEARDSLGVGVVKLVFEPNPQAVDLAKSLIQRAKEQLASDITQRNLIDLVETIIIYKFPTKSREEIEAMLGLDDLKQTKVYQEAISEGERKAKFESVARMLRLGLSVEVIAEALDLPVEVVRQVTLPD